MVRAVLWILGTTQPRCQFLPPQPLRRPYPLGRWAVATPASLRAVMSARPGARPQTLDPILTMMTSRPTDRRNVTWFIAWMLTGAGGRAGARAAEPPLRSARQGSAEAHNRDRLFRRVAVFGTLAMTPVILLKDLSELEDGPPFKTDAQQRLRGTLKAFPGLDLES